MRPELQSLLSRLPEIEPERLPELLGELETIRATALLKMAAPAPRQDADELLPIQVAAERLSVSTDYLYRHANRLPFTRRMGRKLLFSARGIDAYIKTKRA